MKIDAEGLKAKTDIVSVVSAYVKLAKRGSEYIGLCPFHADKRPSFWVIPAKSFCHCFACGANHDVISFVQEIEGVDFKQACEKLGAETWTPRAPIKHEPAPPTERITSKPPPEAGEPKMTIRGLGEPVRTWRYLDSEGAVLGYVARYDEADGKKEFRCWSWGVRGNAEPAWSCGHFTKPRHLYGLDRLAAHPTAMVLLVEGEKACDAAQALLPHYVALTWPGGANAWKHANLEPLRGRKVLLWPDNDEPGIDAMDGIAAILADPRGLAAKVRIIDPQGMPDGFDAADWTGSPDELVAWAKPRASDYVPAGAATETQEEASDAPPPEPPPEPETLPEKPQRKRKAHLAVVGNTALAPEAEPEALPAPMSEDALADHFASIHSERWRFVKLWNTWLEWRGDGWHRDETGMADRMCIQITRQALYWQEAQQLNPDGKRRISSKRTAGSIRDMAANDPRIAATADQWDTNAWLLGVPGGVVDLKTGKLIAAAATQYITKRCSVAPAPGECEHWVGLLERVTQGDASLMEYLQRLCGYVLTGETREECFAFVYGPAQTGKSTFIRVISEILGEYHCKASMETFTETRHERHAEELAVLAGARLVTAVETEEGRRWNESRIKALTGRDRIRARFMRENSFEFDPQFKLIIAGNHAPHLRNVDDAMRRRLHIIPFTQPIPMEERDDRLAEKLRSEYPQILAWMVRGALDWQVSKLGRPDQIAQAVDDYLESEDTFGEWLNEATVRDKAARCLSGGAYKAYKQWADGAGEYAMSQKRFVQALKERGFDTTRAGGKRFISGLSLRETESPPMGRYPGDA